MPIDYQRDDDRRLITLTFTEPFSFEEAVNQAERQSAEGIWTYAVLYDLRAVSRAASPAQMQEGLSRIELVGAGRPRGPVGVAIAPRLEMFASGLHYTKAAGPSRDIEVLLTATQIEAWLARSAPTRHRSSDGRR